MPSELTIRAPSKWARVWPEGAALFSMHEKELGIADPRLPHRIDVGLAMKLEELGVLRVVSGHDAGILIAYAFWFLSPNLMSQGKITATQGPFFVHPQWRQSRIGIQIWRESLAMLRHDDVTEVEVHSFVGSPKGLAKLYARSGGTPFAEVWRIML